MAHICRCKLCDKEFDGVLDAHASLIWKYAELAKIVTRISEHHRGNRPDSLKHAIADADDFLKPPVDREPLLTPAEEDEILDRPYTRQDEIDDNSGRVFDPQERIAEARNRATASQLEADRIAADTLAAR